MLSFVICVAVTVLDQSTKQWILRHFILDEQVSVIPGFFNLTYLRNTGAAWGMLSGQNKWLIVLSIVVILALLIFRKSFIAETRLHAVSYGLMLGGIIGNVLDRIRYEWVIDFLDFYVGHYHWPSFNVADSAICTGVGLYMLSTFLMTDKKDHIAGNH